METKRKKRRIQKKNKNRKKYLKSNILNKRFMSGKIEKIKETRKKYESNRVVSLPKKN